MHNCPNCGIALRKYEDFHFGNVSIRQQTDVILDGQKIDMAPASRLIVEALIRAEGRPLSRDVLLQIAGVEDGEDGFDVRTIDVYVGRARKAFKVVFPKFDQLVTERGFGYRWVRKAARERVREPQLALVA